MRLLRTFLCTAALLPFGMMAQAATSYDLAGDFSNALNPNGAWSFTLGGVPLAHVFPVNNGNPFMPVTQNGYWSTGNNLYANSPDVIRATQSGTAAGETANDFLAGDVIIHSPNPGSSSSPLLLSWTAPTDGQLQYSAAVWYAHSLVSRSNSVQLVLNGTVLDQRVIDNSSNRSLPGLSATGALGVKAGDVLSLSFVASAGQTYGSVDGVAETLNFTSSVPEPTSWALALAGGALMLGVRQRSRRR